MISAGIALNAGWWGVSLIALLWVLAFALSVTMIGAAILMVTMLFGRKGTINTTAKSFAVSMLIHVALGFGMATWLVWHNVFPPAMLGAEREDPPPIQLQDVLIEGEEKVESEKTGNTPIWDQLPEPEETEVARLERVPVDWQQEENLERTVDPLPEPELSETELPSFPEEAVVTPQPESEGQTGPLQEAAVSLKVDEETTQARPEISGSKSPVRRSVVRQGQVEASVDRNPTRGSIDYLDNEFTPSQRIASIEGSDNPTAFLKKAPVERTMQSRTGPTPSPLTDPEAGRNAQNRTDGGKTASAGPKRVSRQAVQNRTGREDGTLAPLRRRQTPQSPSPTSKREVAVRDSRPNELIETGPRPNVLQPELARNRVGTNKDIPTTYRLRSLSSRAEAARKYGGTDASERAVESSLQWLALQQKPSGYWDSSAFGGGSVRVAQDGTDKRGVKLEKGVPGSRADVGVTALAMLAFLGADYTHERGHYADEVSRAIRWLIANQTEDGYLGGNATYFARMYCHGMATYALAEAYGMQENRDGAIKLREPLERAVGYIAASQNADGGWRYVKRQRSDMSMFGWQMMALKSAEIAGIEIPDKVRSGMIRFLKDRSLGKHRGLATYRQTEKPMPPSHAMTAEALFCKQMLGIDRANPQCVEAVDFLINRIPRRSQTNLYYWYYGTLSLYQYGGKPWRQWNESLRDQLVATQETSGPLAGSWDPVGPWGAYGGRVYSTALSTLCLEVYYRFLPLYQMGGIYDEKQD
jgi:hypothetical protein